MKRAPKAPPSPSLYFDGKILQALGLNIALISAGYRDHPRCAAGSCGKLRQQPSYFQDSNSGRRSPHPPKQNICFVIRKMTKERGLTRVEALRGIVRPKAMKDGSEGSAKV